LIAVDKLPRAQRRFPDQLDWLQARLGELPESEVRWQADFVAQGNALHQAEIPLMIACNSGWGPMSGGCRSAICLVQAAFSLP